MLSPRENQWEALNLVGDDTLFDWRRKVFSVLQVIRDAGDDHAAFEEQ